MLTAFIRAFRTPDLRKKLLFTLGMIVLFRFGATLPTPGINEANVKYCSGLAENNGALQLIYVLSGNSLKYMTVFALGIMPYITASIILQLLTVVIPRLETLKNEGQAGQAKITQYTRYLTIGLAILQSTGYIELARTGEIFAGTTCQTDASAYPLITSPSVFRIATMVIIMVSGTAVIMLMGELITDRGVGNGMSVLIFTQVLAYLPGEISEVKESKGYFYAGIAIVVIIVIFGFVVFMEQAQRRIPVQYAKRMVGRRMYGGTSTYIPIKVNQAGVIPVIFASSLLYIPQLAVSLFGNTSKPNGWQNFVDKYLEQGTGSLQSGWVYMLLFFVLIVAFTYFYVSITFNPVEVADNMKKYGGFIPGIRPGRPTAEYLGYVLNRLTAPGSVYLAVVGLFPMVALALIGVANDIPFSGVSLLIMVGVGLDTVKQIESQLQQRNYEGFLR